MTRERETLTRLWRLTELPNEPLGMVDLTGDDPELPSSFRVGTAAQASIAAVACAVNAIWWMRA